MITIGGTASGTSIDILQGEENAGAILGTVTRYPALITAIAAGTVAMVSDLSAPAPLGGPRRPVSGHSFAPSVSTESPHVAGARAGAGQKGEPTEPSAWL